MPAKRIILLDRPPNAMWYRYVLWADVPAGNQMAYRNPAATSAYENATPAELQAIRDGLVAERAGQYQTDATSVATVQSALQAVWTEFQAEVSAVTAWVDYGRYWDGAAWQPSVGVPLVSCKCLLEGLPTFHALTAVSAFGNNKFQFVLHNNPTVGLGQAQVVKVREVRVLPGIAAVTGVAPSAWSLQRRSGLTTPPSGTGSFAPAKTDSSVALLPGITCYGTPQVAPAGGSMELFGSFIPQADEQKLTTLDAPTMSALNGGVLVYAGRDQCRPLSVRAGETLEVVQSATGGTGNCQVLCIFTVG